MQQSVKHNPSRNVSNGEKFPYLRNWKEFEIYLQNLEMVTFIKSKYEVKQWVALNN